MLAPAALIKIQTVNDMTEKGKKGKITIESERCKGCYLCISTCPNEKITISNKMNLQGYYPAEFVESENEEKNCIACAKCATICPDTAIEVYRE